jgi:hypothetical protein
MWLGYVVPSAPSASTVLGLNCRLIEEEGRVDVVVELVVEEIDVVVELVVEEIDVVVEVVVVVVCWKIAVKVRGASTAY